MTKRSLLFTLVFLTFLNLNSIVAAQTQPGPKANPTIVKKHGMAIPYQKGIIESQIKAGKTVFLSFDAKRCPSCVALDKDIKKNLTQLPEKYVIIQADFDKETGLKKTFKVTKQNTVLVLTKSKKGYVVSARSKGYITTLSKVIALVK